MKNLLILLTLFATFCTVASPKLALAEEVTICNLKLEDLSRFQDEDTKQLNKLALYNFLTKENEVLFSYVHFRAVEDVRNSRDISIGDFKKYFAYASEKQKTDFAGSVWNNIVETYKPSTVVSALTYRTNAVGLTDVDSFSLEEISRIGKYAQRLGLTYPEFLKIYQITQSIERNPEIKKQVISLIASSIVKSAVIGKQLTEANASAKNWKTNIGGFLARESRSSTLAAFNVLTWIFGGGATVLGGIGMLAGDPVATMIASAGAGSILAVPVGYSAIKGLPATYKKAAAGIRQKLLKRSLEKDLRKTLVTSSSDEGEE